MNRAMRLAAWVGLGAVLVAGPGCGLMDQFEDDDDGIPHMTQYNREMPPASGSGMPAVPAAGVTQTGADAATPAGEVGTQAGVYPDNGKR
jgi:hypothetical protein